MSGTETKMSKQRNESRKDRGISLLVSIILVFLVLGLIVFSVSHKITREMSVSATQNLIESLDLIKCTIEVILNKEAANVVDGADFLAQKAPVVMA